MSHLVSHKSMFCGLLPSNLTTPKWNKNKLTYAISYLRQKLTEESINPIL